jgi:hypothetical protein
MRVFHVMLKGPQPHQFGYNCYCCSTCSGVADDVNDETIIEHFAKAGPILKVSAFSL